MTENLRRTAEQAVRTAANLTRRHLHEFWSVADRSDKPVARSGTRRLHDDAMERDRLLTAQSEAHKKAHAAIEALRAIDPSGADELVRLGVILGTSKDAGFDA